MRSAGSKLIDRRKPASTRAKIRCLPLIDPSREQQGLPGIRVDPDIVFEGHPLVTDGDRPQRRRDQNLGDIITSQDFGPYPFGQFVTTIGSPTAKAGGGFEAVSLYTSPSPRDS